MTVASRTFGAEGWYSIQKGVYFSVIGETRRLSCGYAHERKNAELSFSFVRVKFTMPAFLQ
jgi:hypothetical protein